MKIFEELIGQGIDRGASDIHLIAGQVPVYRINGRLLASNQHIILSAAEIKNMGQKLINENRRRQFEREGQVDFAVSLPGICRIRINLYSQSGSWAMAVRILPSLIPDFYSLGLPSIILQLLQMNGGLILVAGSTGSGKTTSLAAMINLLNHIRHLNIITLEDPVEYQHQHGTCLVNQREVGNDTESFASGLRAALRQDPDLILIGELRDPETIFTTLSAAQTGHLVLASLHSGSSTQAIERMVNGFPAHQQGQIRVQLAGTLLGIITQQLIPAVGGQGRVLAAEILIVNTAISNLIRENRIYQIPSAIQTGSAWGMRDMDKAIQLLGEAKKISPSEQCLSQELKRLQFEGREVWCDSSFA